MQAEMYIGGDQSRSKMAIEPRIVRFNFADIDEKRFYADNPMISSLWVALSAMFPAGEAEFIKSVKLFEDKVTDPKLKEEVKHFAHQEAHHSVHHKKINQMFQNLGYPVGKVEEKLKERLAFREANWSAEKRLARTVCAEHVTATIANWALTNPEHMAPFPASFRNLFLWHAIEEIEHKSVAFDVYQETVGDAKLLRSEYRRFLYTEFPVNLFFASKALMKFSGQKASWKHLKGLYKVLLSKTGVVRAPKDHYFAFNKKGFHPWQHDDAALVDEWQEKLSPHFAN